MAGVGSTAGASVLRGAPARGVPCSAAIARSILFLSSMSRLSMWSVGIRSHRITGVIRNQAITTRRHGQRGEVSDLVVRLVASERGLERQTQTILKQQPMYKVTIQATPAGESNWSVVTTGRWTPGQPPQLAEETLPATVVEALFNITPSATDQSRRNQVQHGDTCYAVVFRKLSR